MDSSLSSSRNIARVARRATFAPRERVLALCLAVLLPSISSALMAHSAVLLTIPFSLYFISIAVIAVIGGLGPALVAAAFCVMSRHLFIAPGESLLALNLAGLYRFTTLIVCAVLVSTADRRRRLAAASFSVANEDLHERTRALEAALHVGKCATWTRDFNRDGAIRWYRGSFPIFGRPFPEDQDHQALFDWLHPDDHQVIFRMVEHMRTSSEPIVIEYRTFWPNGEIHWLEAHGNPVPDAPRHWRGITIDVTERKRTQSVLLRTEKLAAMGRLASTVAHEINNPLESVTNLLYLAKADPSLSPVTFDYLQTAESELARLGEITRLTLGFVRNSGARQPLLIADIVDDVLAIFRRRLESREIVVRRELEPGLQLGIVPHELRQILTNLISNAVDAITHPHGTLLICSRRVPSGVQLVIEDNGSGISETALARVFEPFFSTKDDTGTGIGLWVTRELVESNGGSIAVESRDLPNGMKTRFCLDFPSPYPAA